MVLRHAVAVCLALLRLAETDMQGRTVVASSVIFRGVAAVVSLHMMSAVDVFQATEILSGALLSILNIRFPIYSHHYWRSRQGP